MKITASNLAENAYQVYGTSKGWKNTQGISMKPWVQLSSEEQSCWVTVITATAFELDKSRNTEDLNITIRELSNNPFVQTIQ